MIDPAIFEQPTLGELASRRSAKWTLYPPDVLPAFVAELDVPLAEPIARALHEAVARGDTGYAHPTALANAYATFARTRFDWTIDTSCCFAVPDVMVGVVEALRVLVRPGDAVAINTPVYAPFFSALDEAGCRRVDVPLRHSHGAYDLDVTGLEAAFRAGVRAYLLCNPHNPVGRTFSAATLGDVAQLAARYGVVVLADEIHAPLVLAGARHEPFAKLASACGARALALVSASKAWNLAGLKCALVIAGDADVAATLARMPKEVRYRVGHFGALAATTAFAEGGPWLDALRAHLDANRRLLADLLAAELPEVGYVPPEATYLAWLDCSRLGFTEPAAKAFLRDGRVALSPGIDFGPGGASHVRLNFGTTRAILRDIVTRLARAVYLAREGPNSGRIPCPPRSRT